MPLLHVVVVAGGSDWQRGLALWLLAAAVGGGFAALSGEWRAPDSLLLDLLLAVAGGAAANLASRPLGNDPLAALYGLRVFWILAGALVCLLLAHDAVRLLPPAWLAARGGPVPLRNGGGFLFLVLWLSGWPTEPGLVEATYGDGLALKLLPAALHYQVRVRTVRTARTLPFAGVAGALAECDTLIVILAPHPLDLNAEDGKRRFARVRPTEGAAALADALTRFIQGAETRRSP